MSRTDWSQLYRDTYHDLVRFLHRKVWDIERAQDLAQEVFVRALDSNPDSPRSWLFTIAANLARDEARAAIRRKKHLVLIKGEAEAHQAEADDPVAELVDAEQMETVREALHSLSDRDQEVLLLWDAGLNYEEIAAETGLSRGAIGTTLSRARTRLVAAYDRLERTNVAGG